MRQYLPKVGPPLSLAQCLDYLFDTLIVLEKNSLVLEMHSL